MYKLYLLFCLKYMKVPENAYKSFISAIRYNYPCITLITDSDHHYIQWILMTIL